jgi:hypothetical protein
MGFLTLLNYELLDYLAFALCFWRAFGRLSLYNIVSKSPPPHFSNYGCCADHAGGHERSTECLPANFFPGYPTVDVQAVAEHGREKNSRQYDGKKSS